MIRLWPGIPRDDLMGSAVLLGVDLPIVHVQLRRSNDGLQSNTKTREPTETDYAASPSQPGGNGAT